MIQISKPFLVNNIMIPLPLKKIVFILRLKKLGSETNEKSIFRFLMFGNSNLTNCLKKIFPVCIVLKRIQHVVS